MRRVATEETFSIPEVAAALRANATPRKEVPAAAVSRVVKDSLEA